MARVLPLALPALTLLNGPTTTDNSSREQRTFTIMYILVAAAHVDKRQRDLENGGGRTIGCCKVEILQQRDDLGTGV
jgi:hypothetical protein